MLNYCYSCTFVALLSCGGILYPANHVSAATATRLIGELDWYDTPDGFADFIEGLGDIRTNATGAYAIRGRTYPPFNNTGYGFLYGRPDALTASSVLQEETDVTIGPTTYYREGYGSTGYFNNTGHFAYEADVSTSPGGTQINTVWIDNAPVLFEGDSISGIPGQSFEFFGLTGFSDTGVLYYKAGFGGNQTGFFSGTGTPIFKTGDPIGGYGGNVLDDDLGSIGNIFMSPDGSNFMTEIDVNPAVWSPSTPFPITNLMILNGSAAAFASDPNAFLLEGQTIPVADGGIGDSWDGSYSRYAVNNDGKWAVAGDTDHVSNDAVIVVDGTIVAREGDSLPTESGGTTTLTGQAKNVVINEQGDVAYTFGDSIFINDVEYVTIGNVVDTGETLTKIQLGLAMTDRDANNLVTVFFIGRDTHDTSNNGDTAYSIQLTLPVPSIPGDLNSDGFVGLDDLDIILTNWNQTIPPGDLLADPSGDGFVGLDDLDIVLNNWNAGTPPRSISIPEPMTYVMFGSMSWLWLRVRRT